MLAKYVVKHSRLKAGLIGIKRMHMSMELKKDSFKDFLCGALCWLADLCFKKSANYFV